MSDPIKVTGMICSMIGFVVCLVLGQDVLSKTFFSIFCALIGLPVVGKGLQKLVK